MIDFPFRKTFCFFFVLWMTFLKNIDIEREIIWYRWLSVLFKSFTFFQNYIKTLRCMLISQRKVIYHWRRTLISFRKCKNTQGVIFKNRFLFLSRKKAAFSLVLSLDQSKQLKHNTSCYCMLSDSRHCCSIWNPLSLM